MKRCPSCNQILVRRRIGQIEVDGCPSCGGAWLDDGELAALGQADPDNLRKLDELFVAGMQQAVGARRTNNCPVCSSPLAPFEYGSLAGIELDGCRTCKGVWLDDGEATQIADRLAPPAPQPATPAVAAAVAPVSSPQAPSGADLTSTDHLPVVRGRRLGHIGHPHGLGGKLSAAFRFIQGAYALALERKSLMLPTVIGLVLQIVLLAGVYGIYLAAGGRSFFERADGQQAVVWVFFVGVTFVGHFFNYFTMGMTVNMVDAYLKGLEPSLKVAVADGVKNLGGIVALSVVGTIVQMITSSLRNNRGMMSRALARSIDSLWTVATFLLLPVIIVEDVGLFTALGRAKDIHRRNILQIAVGEVGLNIINMIAGFIAVGVGVVLWFAFQSLGTTGLVIAIGTTVALALLIGVVNSFAKGAYYTCLYLWAVETERATDPSQVVVPGPLASAIT